MQGIKKRKWTIAEATAWVQKCEDGTQAKGLKYCSALDFLKNQKKG